MTARSAAPIRSFNNSHSGTLNFSRPRTRVSLKASYSLAQVVATPGALAALEKAGQQPGDFLARHVSGDWGEVPPEDSKENEFSLQHGFRLCRSPSPNTGLNRESIQRRPVATRSAGASLCQTIPVTIVGGRIPVTACGTLRRSRRRLPVQGIVSVNAMQCVYADRQTPSGHISIVCRARIIPERNVVNVARGSGSVASRE
jgi:hypothetical protein